MLAELFDQEEAKRRQLAAAIAHKANTDDDGDGEEDAESTRRVKRMKLLQPSDADNAEAARRQEQNAAAQQLVSVKEALVRLVSASLLRQPDFKAADDPTRLALVSLCQQVARHDAEFILKLALYTRRELNIRVTANFLLCLSAWLEAPRPHLPRYFAACVMLPSDWIDVAEQYQLLASTSSDSLPEVSSFAI